VQRVRGNLITTRLSDILYEACAVLSFVLSRTVLPYFKQALIYTRGYA
jgi:hypothetical protein